jgi:23S rRNA pseudouridine1911/1915/1917 synthase
VNKPAGLLSIPDREGKEISLKKILQEKYGAIFTVHRLDKGTSGLILFAKNPDAHKFFSLQFEERQMTKIYRGLVTGSMLDKKGSIDLPISENMATGKTMIDKKGGKESRTDYAVLEDFGIYSWVQFRMHTGRTHQIRIHTRSVGHPLACDDMYGDGKPVFVSAIKHNYKLSRMEETERPILNRLALHAYQLSFTGPDEKYYELEASLPKDLVATLHQLEKRISRKKINK